METRLVEELVDIQSVAHLNASKFYMLASVVILYFDYILTLDLEVRALRNQWTIPMVLFVLNRYYPMVAYAIVLLFMIHPGVERCEKFKRFPLLSAMASEAIIGIIVMIRLYAIYAKSKKILYCLFALYVPQLLLGSWSADAVVQANGLPPGLGCIIAVSKGYEYRFALLWGSSAIFDTAVFVLTMNRVLCLRDKGLKLPLTTLLLRDGILYYAVMFSARLLNFILFWTAVTSDLVTLNWSFNNIITVIMINRLVLNLREEASKKIILSRGFTSDSHAERLDSTFFAEGGQTHVETKSTYEDMDDSSYHTSIPERHWDAHNDLEKGK